MDVFKKIYEEAREKGSEPWEAEVQAAKIIWNAIEKNSYSSLVDTILDLRDESITPELDAVLTKKFNVNNNLLSVCT